MKTISLIILSCSFFCSFAQRNFDKVEIKTQQVSDNIYMLEGAGGNIAILSGDDGTVMIDDQFAELSPKIKEAIKKISNYPVSYLINTHWHGDHTGGNANFAKDGATIIAHDNVRERLSHDQIRPFGRSTPAAEEIAWPQLTFNDNMKVHFNNETINLIHVHNAHTDGDSFVYFENANVLHMGDCFFKDKFPYIDVAMGGSPDGYIKAASIALMLCNSETKIIPGHGSLASKSDLLNFYTMLMTMKDRVQKVITEGKTQEEALALNLTEGYAEWGTGFINEETIVKTLFSAYSLGEE